MPSGVYKRKPLSEERKEILRTRIKIATEAARLVNTGKKRSLFSKEWRENIGKKSKGRHPIKEFKKGNKKSKNAYSFPKGEKHPLWKGGITPLRDKIRNLPEYKLWRWAVFTRDNFTCIWCNKKKEVSGRLEADHIQSFKDFPELRFAIDNGRTLCKDCHKIRHHNERIPAKK